MGEICEIMEMPKAWCAHCLGQKLGDEEEHGYRESEAYRFDGLIETARAIAGNRPRKDNGVGTVP